MFNIDSLLDAVKKVGVKVTKETASYMPALLSEEKRFSNAYAACLALLICADYEVEESETIAAIGFIQKDKLLNEMGLTLSTLEYYGGFIKELSAYFNDKPSFIVQKAKVIEKHVVVDLQNKYKIYLKELCTQLVGVNANANELEVKGELLTAIDK